MYEGLVETWYKKLVRRLRKFRNSKYVQWDYNLAFRMFSYNMIPNSSTKLDPYINIGKKEDTNNLSNYSVNLVNTDFGPVGNTDN